MNARTLLFATVFIAFAVSSFGGRQLAMAESNVKKEDSQTPISIVPNSYHENNEQKVSKKTKNKTEPTYNSAFNLDELKENKTVKQHKVFHAPIPQRLPKKRDAKFIAASTAAASVKKPAISVQAKDTNIVNPNSDNFPAGMPLMSSFGMHLDGTPFTKMEKTIGNKYFMKLQKSPTIAVEEEGELQKLPQTHSKTTSAVTVEGSFLLPKRPSDKETKPFLSTTDDTKKAYTKTKNKILGKTGSSEQKSFMESPWLVAKSAIETFNKFAFIKQKHQENDNESVVSIEKKSSEKDTPKTIKWASSTEEKADSSKLATPSIENKSKEKLFKVQKIYSEKKLVVKKIKLPLPVIKEKPVSAPEVKDIEPIKIAMEEKPFKVQKIYSEKKIVVKKIKFIPPVIKEKPVSAPELSDIEPTKIAMKEKRIYNAKNLDNIQLVAPSIKNESKEKTFKVRKLYSAKKPVVKKIEWSLSIAEKEQPAVHLSTKKAEKKSIVDKVIHHKAPKKDVRVAVSLKPKQITAKTKKEDKIKKKTRIKKRKKKPLLRLLEPKTTPMKKAKTVNAAHQLKKQTMPFTDRIKNFFNSESEFNETTKSTQNVKSLFNSLASGLSFSDTEKLVQKTKIQPTELKIQFEPYSAAMSGQTLKWLQTLSKRAKKDAQVVIEVRMSGSANVSSTLQARRYSLIQGALSSQGIHSSRIRVVLTNRAPDSVVLRSLRIVESTQFFKKQSGAVVNRRAFNW